MKPEPLDKKLDDWLDQALAEYGRAEPPPGLETRTLKSLTRQVVPQAWWQRWPRTVWVSAAAVTIVLFLAVFLVRRENPVAPVPAMVNDQELLLGVDRLLNKEVPSALEPALLLTKEISKRQ